MKQPAHLDFATLLGPFIAVCAIAMSVALDDGKPASLFNWPSLILVVGGTLGATMMAYPVKKFIRLPIFIWQSFKAEKNNPHTHIDQLVNLANQARKGGLLALEENIPTVSDPFTQNALMLVVDGVDSEQVVRALENDNDVTSRRHYVGIAMIATMADIAPAMGMVGTVVGLIGVMENLSDPSQLGPSIAVAFLTTLYGSLLGNLVFKPMSHKLKQKDEEEMFIRELIIEGVLAILESENPRVVRQKLESFLHPKQRTLR